MTTAIGQLQPRQVATVGGDVVALTYAPRTAGPAVVVRLADSTGMVSLVFQGRVDVPGIQPGVHLTAHGRVGTLAGMPVIFNPAYELSEEP